MPKRKGALGTPFVFQFLVKVSQRWGAPDPHSLDWRELGQLYFGPLPPPGPSPSVPNRKCGLCSQIYFNSVPLGTAWVQGLTEGRPHSGCRPW